jgi:hypothetical protein
MHQNGRRAPEGNLAPVIECDLGGVAHSACLLGESETRLAHKMDQLGRSRTGFLMSPTRQTR